MIRVVQLNERYVPNKSRPMNKLQGEQETSTRCIKNTFIFHGDVPLNATRRTVHPEVYHFYGNPLAPAIRDKSFQIAFCCKFSV